MSFPNRPRRTRRTSAVVQQRTPHRSLRSSLIAYDSVEMDDEIAEDDASPTDPYDYDGDGEIDFRDVAIRTELEIGAAEDSPEQAWQHALVRIGRMGLGFLLLVAGVAMAFLPGPGAVTIAAGLAILAKDFVWADRLLRYLRKKVPGIEEEGPIPRSTIIISIMLMVAAGLAAYWWTTGGSEIILGYF